MGCYWSPAPVFTRPDVWWPPMVLPRRRALPLGCLGYLHQVAEQHHSLHQVCTHPRFLHRDTELEHIASPSSSLERATCHQQPPSTTYLGQSSVSSSSTSFAAAISHGGRSITVRTLLLIFVYPTHDPRRCFGCWS